MYALRWRLWPHCQEVLSISREGQWDFSPCMASFIRVTGGYNLPLLSRIYYSLLSCSCMHYKKNVVHWTRWTRVLGQIQKAYHDVNSMIFNLAHVLRSLILSTERIYCCTSMTIATVSLWNNSICQNPSALGPCTSGEVFPCCKCNRIEVWITAFW